jgi:predicted GH43/DUF377 family glycosyl hydrolase
MLKRLFNRCLLEPSDLKPSQPDLQVIGVFNPGVVATDQGIVLLVRVAEHAKERRPGQTALPRWDFHSRRIVLDWESNDALVPVDIRVVRRKRDGLVRRRIDSIEDVRFEPVNENEEFGVEDPRITCIEDRFYFTYVAVSRHGVATALASTADFKSFERHGIIFAPENKDVVLFPERIGGFYYALHRPNGASPFTKPEMWLASGPDLMHWGANAHFLGGTEGWDIGRVGAGTPPLRTSAGWMEIYHGNSRREQDKEVGSYSAGVLLMDLENPRRILGAAGNVFVAETEYERQGFVPNVVFPTGIVQRGEHVLVYYGAADTCTAVVEFSLGDVLELAGRSRGSFPFA